MKKFTIRNQGEIKAQFPAESIDEQEALNAIHKFWGFPERPEIGEDGEPTGVILPADYTIEVEDITAQVAQDAINAEALAYLAYTDWLVIREVDAGTECPADVKAERAAARARIVR